MILSRGNFWPKLSKICLEQLVRQRHPAQHAVIPTDAEVKFQKKSQNLVARTDLLSSDLDTEVNERQSNLLLDELEVGLLLLPVLQVVHQAGHLVQ